MSAPLSRALGAFGVRSATGYNICKNARHSVGFRNSSTYAAKTIHGLPLHKMVGDHSWAQDDLASMGEEMRKGSWMERVKMFGGQREITEEVFFECPDGVRDLVDELLALDRVEITKVCQMLSKRLGATEEKKAKAQTFPYNVPMGAEGNYLSSNTGKSSSAVPGTAPAAEVKEKVSFDLKLKSFDATAKIKVIKEVRAATGLGLKEAKDLVDSAPGVIKKGLTKEEAEAIQKVFAEAGAVIELV
jgi:large subunit ribosomal protein L7/L12